MSNTMRIVRRDIFRLLRIPSAWVIILGLTIIPSLYAWFNIYGLWDPYGNTGNITIAVVNEDTGANLPTSEQLNAGEEIVAQLQANNQLNWRFTDRTQALNDVSSADAYAAIIIPANFSEKLTSIAQGATDRPTLEYYVNEKANALTPKITNQGATTLDRQINDTFVSTAAKIISTTINDTAENVDTRVQSFSTQTQQKITSARTGINTARSSIAELMTDLQAVPTKTSEARSALDSISATTNLSALSLQSLALLISTTQDDLNNFATTSSTQLDSASTSLTDLSFRTNTQVQKVTGALSQANSTASSVVSSLTLVNDDLGQVLTTLTDLVNSGVITSPDAQNILNSITALHTEIDETLTDLSAINTNVQNTIDNSAALSETLTHSVQSTLTAASDLRQTLNGQALPQVTSGLTTLSSTSASLSTWANSQHNTLTQVRTILDQVDQIAALAENALRQTDTHLASLQGTFDTIVTDLKALESANTLATLTGADGRLNADAIADFMSSPTVLQTENIYPVDSYGSGMAPLFTTLALWVGVFMLVVIMKVEVDDEELTHLNLTATQKYFARFLLLAGPATAQGVICTVGNLIIGVQSVSPPIFVLTGAITSLVYLSIVYALSTTFMHIGKGLCLALVMVQIPGASGLYPVEMLPGFFRVLAPIVPFTYSIGAFRETIAGFYDHRWLTMIGALLLFAAVAFIIGLVVRPALTNLNRLFAQQLAQPHMIQSEDVHLPDRRYTMSHIIRSLADKDAYRQEIARQTRRFTGMYPQLKRGALMAGIFVPAILIITFSLTTNAKGMALGAWVVWLVLVLGFLVVIEYMRDSLVRQQELGDMSDDVIQAMLRSHRRRFTAPRHAALEATRVTSTSENVRTEKTVGSTTPENSPSIPQHPETQPGVPTHHATNAPTTDAHHSAASDTHTVGAHTAVSPADTQTPENPTLSHGHIATHLQGATQVSVDTQASTTPDSHTTEDETTSTPTERSSHSENHIKLHGEHLDDTNINEDEVK